MYYTVRFVLFMLSNYMFSLRFPRKKKYACRLSFLLQGVHVFFIYLPILGSNTISSGAGLTLPVHYLLLVGFLLLPH